MSKIKELQNEIRRLKKLSEKDPVVVTVDWPKLEKQIKDTLESPIKEIFEKQIKDIKDIYAKYAELGSESNKENRDAIKAEWKNFIETVENYFDTLDNSFLDTITEHTKDLVTKDELQKHGTSIIEKITGLIEKAPAWYKETKIDGLLTALLTIVDSKQTAERNDTLEEMESRLDEREKKLWLKIKQLVAKVAVNEQRMPGGGAPTVTKDLSSQADSSIFIFNTPTKYRAGSLAIFSTQFPRTYRPVIDFTEDGGTQFTLQSSEVGAPKTGQTLIARYDEIF